MFDMNKVIRINMEEQGVMKFRDLICGLINRKQQLRYLLDLRAQVLGKSGGPGQIVDNQGLEESNRISQAHLDKEEMDNSKWKYFRY